MLRHYSDLSEDAPGQLLAERGETSLSVNSLAAYASASAAAGTAPAGTPGSADSDPALQEMAMPPLEATFTPAPPISYTTPGQQAATTVGAEGDKALGDLVDASDDSSDSSSDD